MLPHALLVAHIAVLGYWLGSELVINSTYRHVSFSSLMPFAERDRLMDHVMDADQHVRYALILQAGLGTALSALHGFIPGGPALAVAAGLAMLPWLALVEAAHRLRKSRAGRRLAALDRAVRHALLLLLLGFAAAALAGATTTPDWLAWKLAAFAGVVACGLGIRYALTSFYSTWQRMAREGSSEACEREIRSIYFRATSVLAVLWLLIAAMTVLSIVKPG